MQTTSTYFLLLAIATACGSKTESTPTPSTPSTKPTEYVVSTLAGGETEGYRDGPGATALFNAANSLICDKQDNILVADQGNNRIRQITPAGLVSSLAGGGTDTDWTANTNPLKASLKRPRFMNFAPNGELLISEMSDRYYDKTNVLFRVYSATGGIRNVVYSNPPATFNNQFYGNRGVFQDAAGNYYLPEDQTIRKISPQGVHTPAWVSVPSRITNQLTGNITAIDSKGTIYFPTEDFSSFTNGTITKVSADGKISYLRDAKFDDKVLNGDLSKVFLGGLRSLTIDKQDNLYVVTSGDQLVFDRIYKITPDNQVTFVAGGKGSDFKDGKGADALFNYIAGIAVDSKGIIYVSDWGRIRKIAPAQ